MQPEILIRTKQKSEILKYLQSEVGLHSVDILCFSRSLEMMTFFDVYFRFSADKWCNGR